MAVTTEIITVECIEEMLPHFEGLGQEDLAIFDVDYVLTQSSDPAYQMPAMVEHNVFVKSLMSQMTALEKDLFLTRMVISEDSVIIDEQMIQLVQRLIDDEIKTMALTAFMTGSFDDIENTMEWRFSHLKKLGLDFSQTFPQCESIVFENFPTYRDHYPVFEKGVLYSNGSFNPISKGELLIDFLDRIDFEPKTVIFVDDRLNNLEKAEKFLAERSTFIGLHYVGAKHFPASDLDAEMTIKKYKELARKAMI